MLVLQTLLPALLLADRPTRLLLRGGTYNPATSSGEFAALALAPALAKLGARLEVELLRPGFFPAGGGEVLATVHPPADPQPLLWLERGAVQSISALCHLADVPEHVGDREVQWLRRALNLAENAVQVLDWPECGPGNALAAAVQAEHAAEVVTGFGKRGVSASQVAAHVALEVQQWLAADVPVGAHLADQLIAPLAVLCGGSFRTVQPTPHLLSQIEVVRALLGDRVALHSASPGHWVVEVKGCRCAVG